MASLGKNEKVRFPMIQVDKNILSYGYSFICIDNISLVTISTIPSNKSWIFAILLGILGGFTINILGLLGLLLLIVAIIWFVAVLAYNASRGDNFTIVLNSGTSLYFNCKNREFLNIVVKTVLDSINGKNKSTYTISFDRCSITDGILNNSTLIGN